MGTTATGFVYPDNGYTSGIRQAIQDLADSAEGVFRAAATPRFADAAARDAAITSPTLGMKSVLTSDEVVYRYNGSAWKAWESDWITYTATLTNVAVGTGGSAGNVAKYRYLGGKIRVRTILTLGTSGASVSGIPAISLPVTAAALAYSTELYPPFGSSLLDATGGTYFSGVGAVTGSTTSARMLLIGTNGVIGAISSTSPFTWAANDIMVFDFTYEPA